ncbi:MAG TPA: CAP domain-containing protein [Mycobacteriales bacterium]|jgi:hypothetical protein|nr:CAP domain-containing protein [Mycobacteriales bacterium]
MTIRRIALVAAAASSLAFLPANTASAVTSADLNSFDRQLIADLNAARIERGIAPLNLSNRLTPIATGWSQQLAAGQVLTNNPHIRAAVNSACPAWRKLGETVGEASGSTADELFASFMSNADDRHTVLNRKFTWVGVHGEPVVGDNGTTTMWSVLDFANHCS